VCLLRVFGGVVVPVLCVCSVVWWFLCCVCCAYDLCFVKLWHLRAGYPASNLKIFLKRSATRIMKERLYYNVCGCEGEWVREVVIVGDC